jgi:hypothetical protein
LASEPVTFVTKASCNTFASLVCAPIALTNKIKADFDFSDLRSQIFICIKADLDFRDFQCQFFNNIISDLDFSDFQRQLIINIKADSNFNQFLSSMFHQPKTKSTTSKSINALPFGCKSNKSFNDKPSSTFQLVVASVNWISKAISSLNQIKANANLQKMDNFQQGAAPHFNVGRLHKLIVSFKYNPTFEGVQTASKSLMHIVGYSKSMTAKTVSIIFCDRSFKFIGKLILEGAQFAPTITFQASS